MCCLLHDVRDLLGENLRGRVLAVDLPIRLRTLARPRDEHSEVGAHARVDDANVWTDDGNLLDYGVVDEDGRGLAFCGNNNSIGSYNNVETSYEAVQDT